MFADISGNAIHYKEYGTGIPVVCIHGFPEDHRVMEGCLEPVFQQRQGYRRIYLDLPGMGKSPSTDRISNADDMLDLLVAFIQAVIGRNPFLLVGQSYGAYLSVGVLLSQLKEQISGVLFVCPCLEPDSALRQTPQKRILENDGSLKNPAQTVEHQDFLEFAVVATHTAWERYRREILPGLNAADEEFTRRYQAMGYSFSFHSELENLVFEKPACVLLGRQDNCVGYLDGLVFSHRFPRATYGILDSAGHNLQIERVPLFNAFVEDWLHRLEVEKPLDGS